MHQTGLNYDLALVSNWDALAKAPFARINKLNSIWKPGAVRTLPDEAELDDKQMKELQKRRKKEAKDALKIRKKESKLEQERVRAVEETPMPTERDLEEPDDSPSAPKGVSWKGVAALAAILVLLVAVSFVISFVHPFLGGALLTVGGFLLGIARKDVRRVLGLD